MITLLLLALQAPPDEAKCLAVARKLEESIGKGDGSVVDQLLDKNRLMERTFQDTPGEAKTKAEFKAGVLKSFGLGAASAKTVREQNGTYTFLRLRTEGNARRALFRMNMEDSFNYHDFLLEAGPGGAVRATDLHVLLTGEWISETLRRVYLGAVASEPGFLGKLTGQQNEFVKTQTRINSMTKLRQQGKSAEALKVYASLAPEARKDKMALIGRYQAALEVAPEELPKVLEDFEKAHPGDACLPAISISAHVQSGRLDKALAAVDAVDQALGGDPFFDLQRAEIHFKAKALDKAKAAASRALERDKSLVEACWILVTISITEKAYADTVKWLNAVEKDFGLELGDLTDVELYADFVKTPEYLAWMKGRKK